MKQGNQFYLHFACLADRVVASQKRVRVEFVAGNSTRSIPDTQTYIRSLSRQYHHFAKMYVTSETNNRI